MKYYKISSVSSYRQEPSNNKGLRADDIKKVSSGYRQG